MRTGVHANEMADALSVADGVYALNPSEFNLIDVVKNWRCPYQILPNTAAIIEKVVDALQAKDAVLVMSNRGFENIHTRLIKCIDDKFAEIIHR